MTPKQAKKLALNAAKNALFLNFISTAKLQMVGTHGASHVLKKETNDRRKKDTVVLKAALRFFYVAALLALKNAGMNFLYRPIIYARCGKRSTVCARIQV